MALTTVGANTAELGALNIPMIVIVPTQHILVMEAWDGLIGLIGIPYKTKINISKASFNVKTVQFKNNEFYSDLSEKLFWGLDKRN